MMKFKCPACHKTFRARTVPFCGRQVARCPCGGMVDGKDAVPARHPVRWIGRQLSGIFGWLTWPVRRRRPAESLNYSAARAEATLRDLKTEIWYIRGCKPFSRAWALVDPEKPVQGEPSKVPEADAKWREPASVVNDPATDRLKVFIQGGSGPCARCGEIIKWSDKAYYISAEGCVCKKCYEGEGKLVAHVDEDSFEGDLRLDTDNDWVFTAGDVIRINRNGPRDEAAVVAWTGRGGEGVALVKPLRYTHRTKDLDTVEIVHHYASGGILNPNRPVSPSGNEGKEAVIPLKNRTVRITSIEPGTLVYIHALPSSRLRRALSFPFRAAWSALAWPWGRKPVHRGSGGDFVITPGMGGCAPEPHGMIRVYHDAPNVTIEAGRGPVEVREALYIVPDKFKNLRLHIPPNEPAQIAFVMVLDSDFSLGVGDEFRIEGQETLWRVTRKSDYHTPSFIRVKNAYEFEAIDMDPALAADAPAPEKPTLCDCGREISGKNIPPGAKCVSCWLDEQRKRVATAAEKSEPDRTRCRFDFEDKECGYAGACTICDKTFRNCKAHGNAARFGGFPEMPELFGISSRAQAAREAAFRPPWTPKVGEWVWWREAPGPRRIFCINGDGKFVLDDQPHGYYTVHHNDTLRPLALSEVQTEEQAKQFYGRRVEYHGVGINGGPKGTLKEFSKGEFVVLWDLGPRTMTMPADNLTLLPEEEAKP